MRNLTIKRNKSFVGCLAKVQIYIEDGISGDLTIGGVRCRKLGVIKNGEEKTFTIDNEGARVYAIMDRMSKEYCNDFYEIPAGDEDVQLSGQNKRSSRTGNAFRFDGNVSAASLENRKKGSKRGMIVLIVAVVIGVVAGVVSNLPAMSGDSGKKAKDKRFSAEDMSIMLNDNFTEVEFEGLTACYDSATAAVLALKEPFAMAAGAENYTLEEYGKLVLQANGLNSNLKTADGITYFEYQADGADGDSYYYFATVYKTDDAFWLIQYTCKSAKASEFADQFLTWAKSVTFRKSL